MSIRPIRAGLAIAAAALAVSMMPATAAAQPSPCPQWADDHFSHKSNSMTPELGCTNAVNLQEMVRDKSDLQQGKTLGPSDAEHESQAVRRYEEGKVKEQSSSRGTSGVFLTGGTTGGSQ